MHQALYRKWRPRNFDEVCGQEQVTSILKYECQTGHFSHAYLFCGSRGTGKTSCAKILAKAVNCEHPTAAGPCGECAACRSIDSGAATDVLEMDAASNNGVDDIRDIRDEVIYTPSELKYRVYIIDEVHMLSVSAFNALLKTLEEPPEHVIFILATTELQKLPATIVSRCQRFDFRRIATADLSAHLAKIAEKEGFTLEPEAARLIARQAQGGMRDAISLLELCAGARRPITPELVTETVGTTGREGVGRVVASLVRRDYDRLFAAVDDMVRSSRDLAVFWQELISYYRDMLVVRTVPESDAVRYLGSDRQRNRRLAFARRAVYQRDTALAHQPAGGRLIRHATRLRCPSDGRGGHAGPTVRPGAGYRNGSHPLPPFPGGRAVGRRGNPGRSTCCRARRSACRSTRHAPAVRSGSARQHRRLLRQCPLPRRLPRRHRQPDSRSQRLPPQVSESYARCAISARSLTACPRVIPSSAPSCACAVHSGRTTVRLSCALNSRSNAAWHCPDKKPPEALRRALSVCLGHAVAPEDIIGEIEGQADPASPLDVIIEALEDDAASGETPPRESE